MRRILSLVLLLSVTTVLLALPPVAQAEKSAGTVTFSVGLDGCACRQYSSFRLLWREDDGAIVHLSNLMDVLTAGDKDSLLLCDCSHGAGEKYGSVIASIRPLLDRPGVNIVLTRQVWLTYDDVAKNMDELFRNHKREVVSAEDFSF